MSFIKKMFSQATKNESESGKKVNHVVVEIEITEHEYMALDGDDEMVGGESFVFNGDESPDFIRITVDGNEIEFDEDELSDRSKYSDYEPFDMEEKWDSEDIAKFGYYDNIAGKTWEFDVEDFDIEKLSFYYQCFDVKFGPADYDSEEHRITLRYDEAEIEEDFDAYSCENGEFEQEWCLYDDEDDDECSYEEEDEEEEDSSESDRERVSRIFGILSYAIANVDNEVTQEEVSAILGTAKSMDLDCDIVRQRIVMEAKGERDYDSQSTLAASLLEGAREPMFNALVRVALSDFKLSQKELAFLGGISEIWNMDEDLVNAILNYHVEMFGKVNPDRALEIEEEADDNNDCLDDTDAVWAAVIERLPNEISVNASTWEGKPYIHIKPQSKHLGVKDFKYCVEYSSKNSRACVNVESLNGGEEAKRTIQEYIDSKDGPKFIKAMVAQQGAKNKNKWFWSVTTPAEKLNEELVVWYVETITAFYDFFEQEPAGKE